MVGSCSGPSLQINPYAAVRVARRICFAYGLVNVRPVTGRNAKQVYEGAAESIGSLERLSGAHQHACFALSTVVSVVPWEELTDFANAVCGNVT